MDLLLAAQSAGMLARSAQRGSLLCDSLDLFADSDTRRHTRASIAVASDDDADWLEAASRIAPGQNSALVYGSGIDTRPRLLQALARGRSLLGNPPATLERIHSPHEFFRLLDGLEIAYPETRFAAPGGGWLVKPGCGEGGKGVGFAAKKRQPAAGAYYQRQIQGEALSALFLANGEAVRIIGYNTQWTASHDPGQPFLFAGALNRAALDATQRQTIADYAAKLVSALGLVGLNSLDFMLDRGICRVLELNPRPSATMALYDADFDGGLLRWHIAACTGRLPAPRSGPVRALRIVYAPQALAVPEGFRWPDGCHDLPNPGATVGVGQPLCSLIAEGEAIRECRAALKAREHAIMCGLPLVPVEFL